MPVTNIKTRWVNGNLEWLDGSGNIIATWDGTNRKITIPSGSKIDLSAATGLLLLAAGEIVLVDIAAASLDGTIAKVAADRNVIGALEITHRVLLASGADADVDVTLTHKTRIIEARAVMKGAGTTGSIITIKNVTTAITEALDVAAAGDKAVKNFLEIDDAQHEIAAGAKMRVSFASTSGDFPGAEVYVRGLRVA